MNTRPQKLTVSDVAHGLKGATRQVLGSKRWSKRSRRWDSRFSKQTQEVVPKLICLPNKNYL